jgi:hypothetical protein
MRTIKEISESPKRERESRHYRKRNFGILLSSEGSDQKRKTAHEDGHTIRPCSACGTVYKARHYFEQHCRI